MSALAADVAFDFAFLSPSASPSPSPSLEDPATPPLEGMPLLDGSFSFDPYPSLLELPHDHAWHVGSAYKAVSIYPAVSAAESTPDSACTTRFTPPVRQHGPLLLPKIRSQDQEIDAAHTFRPSHHRARSAAGPRPQQATPPPPCGPKPLHSGHAPAPPPAYATSPEAFANMAFAHMSPFAATPPPQPHDELSYPSSLLASPAGFAQDSMTTPSSRRASFHLDAGALDKYGYPACHHQIAFVPAAPASRRHYVFPSCLSRASSPLSLAAAATPEPAPAPSTTLMTYLAAPNPAASLVRTISFPLRDPTIKHFWWDVRNVRSWSGFNVSSILSLPGASALLNAPVPAPVLPRPALSSRHPETEAALHGLCAAYYLPKLNSALAISARRPLQLSVPAKTSAGVNDLLFVANPAGEASAAAAMFGGKPTARLVGLVRSFDRFNTGMRVEGNIKRVDYLRGLAALHYAMREHGCRYGFILTEIELVVVRAGTETTPFFGHLEIASVQLAAPAHSLDAASAPSSSSSSSEALPPLTACLALWALCRFAADETPVGHAHWRAEIGAPAEGTRRKAKPRDAWMPQPQLAEKREAKRSRGWVWPEDTVGRKELGKRGVKYGGI